jgi:hypothetical protein
MRKAARILGLIWIAIVIAAGLILWEQYASVASNIFEMRRAYGVIALVFFAMLPGYFIFRWGKGVYAPKQSVADILRPREPFNRAAEMGHVLSIDRNPDA